MRAIKSRPPTAILFGVGLGVSHAAMGIGLNAVIVLPVPNVANGDVYVPATEAHAVMGNEPFVARVISFGNDAFGTMGFDRV